MNVTIEYQTRMDHTKTESVIIPQFHQDEVRKIIQEEGEAYWGIEVDAHSALDISCVLHKSGEFKWSVEENGLGLDRGEGMAVPFRVGYSEKMSYPESKGLIIEIYRSEYSGLWDQLTEQVKEVTLVGPGIPEIFEANSERPPVKVVSRNLFGEPIPYLHLEPMADPVRGSYMFGGKFGYTSDSRFPARFPLKIHDRSE
jgi:hypothetical protein